MRWIHQILWLLCLGGVAWVGAGCQPKPPWADADARLLPPEPHAEASGNTRADAGLLAQDPAGASLSGYSGSVTAMAAQWPSIPNARLQLPVVSPDGQWIAFQEREDGSQAVTDDLIGGRWMDGIRLRIRNLKTQGDGELVGVKGACWPSWSADGSKLVFVSHDDRGSSIGLWDTQTQATHRKSVGLRRMFSPALSPRGARIAVSAYGERVDQAVIFLIDWEAGRAEPGPPAAGPQVGARWLDEQTLVFIELPREDDGTPGPPVVKRWRIGERQSHPIVPLSAEGDVFDAALSYLGVADPVSPGIESLAYYDHAIGQVVSQPLLASAPVSALEGTHSAAWLTDQWLVVAGRDRVSLVASQGQARVPGSGAGGPVKTKRRLSLMHGTWAVVWASSSDRSVLLVGPDPQDADRLVLMQLWVVAEAQS